MNKLEKQKQKKNNKKIKFSKTVVAKIAIFKSNKTSKTRERIDLPKTNKHKTN